MARMNRDPRATVLDNRRLVESRLGTVVRGNRATLAAAAENDRLSGVMRADLALMADMVKEIERGMVLTEQDAIAFDRAARRVVDALEAVQSRSWAARLDRCSARAGWAAMVVGGAGLTVAGVLFVAMFWVGPPTPAGYDAVMTGTFYLGLAGLASRMSLVLLERSVFASAAGLRWAWRHPLRAAIWLTGVPLIGSVTFVLAGLAGVAAVVGLGVVVALWDRSSPSTRRDTPSHNPVTPGHEAQEIYYGMDPVKAQRLGHHDLAEGRGL